MRIEFETNEGVIRQCVPPAWQRAAWMFAVLRIAATTLSISLLFWALGMHSAVAGGWIAIGIVMAMWAWRWVQQRKVDDPWRQTHLVTLELQPQVVEWHWRGLKQMRYDWRWFRRAGHTEDGLALEVADQSGYVIAPRAACRSADEFRQTCDFVDRQLLTAKRVEELGFGAAKVERRLPLRTDVGQVLFHDTRPARQVALPRAKFRFWIWCFFSIALTLGAWRLAGVQQAIIGTVAMMSMLVLSIIALQWLAQRWAARLIPRGGEEFFVVTNQGFYRGNQFNDEFAAWSHVADARFTASVLELFNGQGQWITAVDLGGLSSPAVANEFAERVFAQVRADVVGDHEIDDEDLNDEMQEWLGEEDQEEETSDGKPKRAAPPPKLEHNFKVIFYCVPLLFFALGIWGNWPHIELEHRRMELWRLPVFWMSEITALFWYLVFGVGFFLGKTRPVGVNWWVWASFAAGFGMDLGITLSERREEHQAFARSIVSPAAQANNATVWTHRGEPHLGRLECEFTDQRGAKHTAIFDLINTKFPTEIVQAANQGKFPFPLEIRYDPDWPAAPLAGGNHRPALQPALHRRHFSDLIRCAVGFAVYLAAARKSSRASRRSSSVSGGKCLLWFHWHIALTFARLFVAACCVETFRRS